MQITLSTGTKSRIKMQTLILYQKPTNCSIFGNRSFVCLVNLKSLPSEQSLVSIQVVLEAEVSRQDWKCKRFRWERPVWIKGKKGVGFLSAVLKGDSGGKILLEELQAAAQFWEKSWLGWWKPKSCLLEKSSSDGSESVSLLCSCISWEEPGGEVALARMKWLIQRGSSQRGQSTLFSKKASSLEVHLSATLGASN